LPKRRQGKSRRFSLDLDLDFHDGEAGAGLPEHELTIGSYGLFKATDKKMLKNDDLAAELGRPEKLVEM
jgi:nucleolar protein 58